MNRRDFITCAAAVLAGAAAPGVARAAGQLGQERRLSLIHARTGERFNRVYFAGGVYDDSAASELDRLMRDYRAGETTPMDVRLYDLLATVQAALDKPGPLYVTSGYRTVATNQQLQAEGRNPAQNSLHLYGMAADVYAPGNSVQALESMAVTLAQGGVGAYPRAGFVHMDVGRVRRWRR